MKIISISKKAFANLEPLKLSRETVNTEGIIYDFNYMGNEKVLKTLYTLNGATFANKLYTLEMLDTNREYLPSSFCLPDSLCAVNGIIVGFTSPKIEGINLSSILKSRYIDYKGQIYYLKKVNLNLKKLF